MSHLQTLLQREQAPEASASPVAAPGESPGLRPWFAYRDLRITTEQPGASDDTPIIEDTFEEGSSTAPQSRTDRADQNFNVPAPRNDESRSPSFHQVPHLPPATAPRYPSVTESIPAPAQSFQAPPQMAQERPAPAPATPAPFAPPLKPVVPQHPENWDAPDPFSRPPDESDASAADEPRGIDTSFMSRPDLPADENPAHSSQQLAAPQFAETQRPVANLVASSASESDADATARRESLNAVLREPMLERSAERSQRISDEMTRNYQPVPMGFDRHEDDFRSAAEPTAGPAPLQISIGRLEVRAVVEPRSQPDRRTPDRSSPAIPTLSEYLERRARETR